MWLYCITFYVYLKTLDYFDIPGDVPKLDKWKIKMMMMMMDLRVRLQDLKRPNSRARRARYAFNVYINSDVCRVPGNYRRLYQCRRLCNKSVTKLHAMGMYKYGV